MIGMVTKEYIRKLYYSQGISIRGIERKTGHSRQYIRKVLREEVPMIPRYISTKTKCERQDETEPVCSKKVSHLC